MSDEELWPGYVGIAVAVPYGETEVGSRLMGPTQRREWNTRLEAKAREAHRPARAVLQDEDTDHLGTPQCISIVWCDPDVSIEGMRHFLHRRGYSVLYATIHYTPPMA